MEEGHAENTFFILGLGAFSRNFRRLDFIIEIGLSRDGGHLGEFRRLGIK